MVGDTAGFVASVYHRGIDVVQAPTTLLAQVDAAIGGKTAVNLPEGKNLVGAFHQPIAVLADVSTLATLPPREYRAGLGEVAKYALMPGGEAVAEIVGKQADAIVERDPATLTALVAACASMKARVVAADPQERTGIRAVAELRAHARAHARDHRWLRAAARRGGRRRPGVRRRARRGAGATRCRRASTRTGQRSSRSGCRRRCRVRSTCPTCST